MSEVVIELAGIAAVGFVFGAGCVAAFVALCFGWLWWVSR